MALAALIAACEQVEEGEELRATLPLVGATLLEHQVRLARRAGAGHIVILVERLPPALTGAFDRLRRDGIAIDIARNAADAADRIHPDEKLLVMQDGCLVAEALLERLVAAPPPTVVTVPDHSERQMFERIDALTRWGGLMLIDGAALRRTVQMLGEWDLLSTLLRRTLQEGTKRLDAFPPDASAKPELLLIADRVETLEGADRRLIGASRARAATWPARYLFPPIEELALRPLAARALDPTWLAAAGALAGILSVPLAVMGWRWAALALLLLSGPLLAVGTRLAATRLALVRYGSWILGVRDAAAGASLLALGRDLAATQGWGMIAVAAGAVAASIALALERRSLLRLGGVTTPWLANTDGLIWAQLWFAAAGAWGVGVAVLAGYALASFFIVQRVVVRRVEAS